MRDEIIKAVLSVNNNYSSIDKNNIVWKNIDGKIIGKRAILTIDNRYCWLEDTTKENVDLWLHKENSNYNEIFTR